MGQTMPGEKVNPLLDSLLELQKLHVQLQRLKTRASGGNAAVAAKEKQVARLKADVEKLGSDRKLAQRAVDAKELDIKTLQGKIAKFREQLNSVKTNKEYQAIQSEIKFAELELRRIEDKAIAEMDRLEKDVTGIDAAQAAVKAAEADLTRLRADQAAGREALEAEIRKAERAREDVARDLPKDVLELFDRIAGKHDNGALSPLVKDDEDSEGGYSCGGCYMRLTENVYVKLLGKSQELIRCPNCYRILYLEP